jgi:hypothetical protein
MTDIASELTRTRDFLDRLKSGALTLRRNHIDVTQYEIAIAKREVAFLEKVLARRRDQAPA